MRKMNILKKSLLVVAAATFTFVSCQPDEMDVQVNNESRLYTQSDNGKIIEGQYIVVLEENAFTDLKSTPSFADRKEMVRAEVASLIGVKSSNEEAIQRVYAKSLFGFSGKLTDEQLRSLSENKKVKFIEEDRIIALGKPSWAGGGSDPQPTGQEVPWGIDRVGYGDGTGKTAWILDSGIDLDHEDLNVDESRAFSAFTKGKDKSPDDGNGHGTHVAGTIAALDNDLGVVGVAAGAFVVPVKVLDSRGSGSYSGVIEGIDYVAANGNNGDVANMSLGGPVSDALDQAVINAAASGVIFCLAAGNESDNANNHSPARANHQNIFTISAMDSNDNFAYFSNYANPPVDYCAPGVAIKSCWKDGGYNTIDGTSMASPHAAGVLLLGAAHSDGTVNNDPDGDADPIIHR